jgi:hypothetical protein
VWFYQSGNVHCEHCLHQKQADVELLYYHDMVAAVVVKHGQETVLPLAPEFIRNKDGREDCERNAESYRWLNPVFLGDDLYADYPTCKAILENVMHFLFTREPDSHSWLYDSIDEG